MKGGNIRLQKEFMQIAKRPRNKLSNFLAAPKGDNMYTWYYLIFGL